MARIVVSVALDAIILAPSIIGLAVAYCYDIIYITPY